MRRDSLPGATKTAGEDRTRIPIRVVRRTLTRRRTRRPWVLDPPVRRVHDRRDLDPQHPEGTAIAIPMRAIELSKWLVVGAAIFSGCTVGHPRRCLAKRRRTHRDERGIRPRRDDASRTRRVGRRGFGRTLVVGAGVRQVTVLVESDDTANRNRDGDSRRSLGGKRSVRTVGTGGHHRVPTRDVWRRYERTRFYPAVYGEADVTVAQRR